MESDPIQVLGAAVASAGVALTTAAQFGMGSSWRIGVDPSERTDLVTDGLFAHVRNPIYSAMTLALAGFALLVPTLLSLISLSAMVAAVQIQVRAVEEPHMMKSYMDYADYAGRVGRFFPGVGRVDT